MPNSSRSTNVLSIRQRFNRITFLLVIIVVFVVGWLLWTKIYESPSNVFWGMISNNLATSSFVNDFNQSASGTSLSEEIQVNTNSDVADAFSIVKQAGSTVKTEEINTPSTDYVRYTSIVTRRKSLSGKPLNFQSVIGVWGKALNNPSSSADQLFSQAILGIVPIGNVPAAQRQNLLQFAKKQDVYTVNFGKVVHQTNRGRLDYVYSVAVRPQAYIELLKNFAKDIGLSGLNSLNPQSYSNLPASTLSITVDASSRSLVSVSYPGNVQKENYSGYGIETLPLALPTDTISQSSLQNRLRAIK